MAYPFSLPEIGFMSAVPYIYQKIYIIAKYTLKTQFLKIPELIYASFAAKTVFIWKYDDWISKNAVATEDNLTYFIGDILKEPFSITEISIFHHISFL